MSGIERLAMLTAHGSSMIGGRGGIDRLTAQDVAAALAMADIGEGAELLALAYSTRESTHMQAWRTWWLRRVQDVAARQQWGEPGHRVTTFGLMTYVDSVGEGRCGHCSGAGVHRNQRTCAECEGSGQQRVTPQWHADRMQMRLLDWLQRWQSRYDAATAVHASWLGRADAIDRRIR